MYSLSSGAYVGYYVKLIFLFALFFAIISLRLCDIEIYLHILLELKESRGKKMNDIAGAFEIDILSLIFELDRTDLKIPELVCKAARKKNLDVVRARSIIYSFEFAERMEPFKLLGICMIFSIRLPACDFGIIVRLKFM